MYKVMTGRGVEESVGEQVPGVVPHVARTPPSPVTIPGPRRVWVHFHSVSPVTTIGVSPVVPRLLVPLLRFLWVRPPLSL